MGLILGNGLIDQGGHTVAARGGLVIMKTQAGNHAHHQPPTQLTAQESGSIVQDGDAGRKILIQVLAHDRDIDIGITHVLADPDSGNRAISR